MVDPYAKAVLFKPNLQYIYNSNWVTEIGTLLEVSLQENKTFHAEGMSLPI